MSTPKAFQKATIERALTAFDRRRHVRRFLVADEVGLGKTVVARGVIERLMHRNHTARPLRVFYVCSSLAIAAQNKDSLLRVIQNTAVRARAASDIDRLTLAPNRKLSGNVPLHLFTLTPGTSIPDRKGMRRTGTVEERALLHNLLASRYPSLTKIGGQGEEWLRRNAVASWEDWKRWSGCRPSPSLRRAFFPILRKQLGLQPSQHLPSVISQKVGEEPLETIGIFRIALAKTALVHLAPDLVIFDEFQRFQDLLDSDDDGSAIAQEMIKGGPGGPAVLLLSATPYRLYGGDTEQLFGEVRHHEQFFSLVKWLYGGDQQADEKKLELQKLFLDYGEALRSADPTGHLTVTIKKKIESRLRPVIARTERFAHQAGQDAAELTEVLAPLKTEDLDLFRHMVRCFEGNSHDHSVSAGTAIAYWSSVPLPMQTLGPEYKAWDQGDRLTIALARECARDAVAVEQPATSLVTGSVEAAVKAPLRRGAEGSVPEIPRPVVEQHAVRPELPALKRQPSPYHVADPGAGVVVHDVGERHVDRDLGPGGEAGNDDGRIALHEGAGPAGRRGLHARHDTGPGCGIARRGQRAGMARVSEPGGLVVSEARVPLHREGFHEKEPVVHPGAEGPMEGRTLSFDHGLRLAGQRDPPARFEELEARQIEPLIVARVAGAA